MNVSGGQTNDRIAGTFHFNVGQSGKYYWEVTFTGTPAASNGAGVRDYSAGTASLVLKLWYYNGATVDGGPTTTFASGDVLGFAMDLSAGTIDCYKNGGSSVGQMDISSLTSVTPFVQTNSGVEMVGNFGQRAFAYSAPSGYKAINTASLPTATVPDGSTAFDAKLYTGNGSSQTISGLGFSPDLVWIKNRSSGDNHALTDTVRGATKWMLSNDTNAELTYPQALTAFTSDGFSVGSDDNFNRNTSSFVAWAWDGGSSTVSNTDGDITSNVRANQTAGFSIVTHTGNGTNPSSVGHGLNSAPVFYITKSRDSTTDWVVSTTVIDGTHDFLDLNNTQAAGAFDAGIPTSSVFYVSGSTTNKSGDDYVTYCWTPVAGYSSFGTYVGNGNASGSFIFTGHLPRFVIIKRSDASVNDWQLYDTARSTFNAMDDKLKANTVGAEIVEHPIDFLSNGFKPRNTQTGSNGSGNRYIYASFASNPFKTTRAR